MISFSYEELKEFSDMFLARENRAPDNYFPTGNKEGNLESAATVATICYSRGDSVSTAIMTTWFNGFLMGREFSEWKRDMDEFKRIEEGIYH